MATDRRRPEREQEQEQGEPVREPGYYRDLANASSDPAVLHELARCPYPFVQHAVAANPCTPPAALAELAVLCGRAPGARAPWNDNRLLLLLARHPAADRAVLSAAVDAAAARLTARTRPYRAVLALAERPELRTEELLALARLPGASARLRGGLRRALAARRPLPEPKPEPKPGPEQGPGAGAGPDQTISRSTP
ncbi:hypothetical protein ACFY00_36725 [Kitasatospora sp. NPDC001540]|uniref:hypothetical protein n=1 Tax=Kitasatospora sp. NPDC001540 TaxID=3364014 RepID=UPI00368D2FE9